MSNIIKREEISPSFTEAEINTVIAAKSTTISRVERSSFYEQMINSVNQALLITGQKSNSAEDIASIAKLVGDQLLQKYPNYKIDEIFHAVKNGAFGEYDKDVIFVSAKNVLRWCVKYQSKKHETLFKQLKHERKMQEEQVDHKQKIIDYYQDLSNQVKADLDCFVKDQDLSPAAEVFFDSLQKIGVITIANNLKKRQYKTVREQELKLAKSKFQRFDPQSLDQRCKTLCRIHFYKKFLSDIGSDWTPTKKLIDQKANEHLF